MFCARCAGYGKIMGNGFVFVECTQCLGKGHYELTPALTPAVVIAHQAPAVTPSTPTPTPTPAIAADIIPITPIIPFQDLIAKVPICPRINKVDKRSRIYRAAIEEIMDECDVSRKDAMIMFAKTYEQIKSSKGTIKADNHAN